MMIKLSTWGLLALLGTFSIRGALSNPDGNYNVGVGIADVTGPSAELGMMGYANPSQTAQGIHTRLFSRAFIFQSGQNEPIVFVSADIGMVDQGLKYKVVEKLKEKFGDIYKAGNVLLSGTHTHSGPGAFLQYLMYGITSLGFMESSFNAIVDGMVQSIERAHHNLQPGKLFINKGVVEGANINRSPTSYLANPEWERNLYNSDVDKDMILLRIEGQDGKPLGSVNWFAVHPTSMNNTNRLLSGDNKGYASMLFESTMNPDARPGKGEFVAAFASSNLGDVSPNTLGPRCIDTGEPCDGETSACGRYVQKCIAFGPGKDMEESTEIIGRKQFDEAFRLFNNTTSAQQLKGDVTFIHQYVNMSNYEVEVRDPITNSSFVKKRTCAGALGYSFAAGTTDGPGMFDFKQGDTSGNDFWNMIRNLLKRPSPELMDCQSPKPILLPVGEANYPYPWIASVVGTQILQVGNLYIIGIPGELTTMAGRRLRKVVEEEIKAKLPNGPAPHVVIAGLSNVYTHYITTYEEYQKQRYEAASTLYGPYTLDAYLTQYKTLTSHLISGQKPEPGPNPPNLLGNQWSLIRPIIMDTAPLLKTFGDVLVEPVPEVNPGETVVAHFAGGHPRHNTMREGTFLLVEKYANATRWKTVATDADWSTKFRWSRPRFMSSENQIEITWQVPADTEPGFYRIRHFGYYKPASESAPRPYQGMTTVFKVTGEGSDTMTHPEWSPKPKKPSKILNVSQFWQALTSIVKG